jgi:hypothetical protein
VGQSNVPTDLTDVKEVAPYAGWHNVATKTDGTIVFWGAGKTTAPYPNYGQSVVPSGLTGIRRLSAGSYHTIAILNDTSVSCWGRNLEGQCNTPAGLTSVVQAAGGDAFTTALRADGTTVCWGMNASGQCNPPTSLVHATQVACGYIHAIALNGDSTVQCWGNNDFGQCNVPPGLTGVKQVACGSYHTIVLKSDGTVVCWGKNDRGQCDVPAGLAGISDICGGFQHTLALRTNIAISRVIPISGPSSGGTAITILGSNFPAAPIVTIGGQPASNVVVVSASKITAVTPPSFPGEATVTVDYGSATAFYYRPECGSDLDQDGEVSTADISIVLLDFGPCYQAPVPAATTGPLPPALPDDSTRP